MTKREIDIFKNELRNFKAYKCEKLLAEQRIKDLEYMLSGCITTPIGERVRTTNPDFRKEHYYSLLRRKDNQLRKLNKYISCIKYIEETLKKLSGETSNALQQIYVGKKTYREVARKMNISVSGLYEKIHTELQKIV